MATPKKNPQSVEDVLYNFGAFTDNVGTALGLSWGDKKKAEFWLSNIPYLGNVIKTKNDYERINDYMRNYGLSWEDVKYDVPYAGGLSGLASAGLNYVSSNITELYEQPRRERRMRRESYDRGRSYELGRMSAHMW